MNVLERFESVAQNYVRAAPIVFDKARGAELFDEKGNRYIDFYAAGGLLSHGHNDIKVCSALIDYLCNDRVLQTCDRTSVAKRRFVEAFVKTVLQPRDLNYRILFTDPASGTSAEVALRLARRHKKKANVVAFTNASHGLTEGALSVTSKQLARSDQLDVRRNVVFMPFCGYSGNDVDTLSYLRRCLEDSASGLDHPAAIIVETVQVDGGVNIASIAWLQGLEQLCRDFGILLIVDETQTGCGRTGPYFSFERAGLKPDMILVSNAIAGGLPLSILLMRPEIDQWRPGEQVGVFQGDALAFIAAAELLSQWNEKLVSAIAARSRILGDELAKLAMKFPASQLRVRGTGMIWGLDIGRRGSGAVLSSWALERGLVVEPARIKDNVLLVLPPATIEESVLRDGLHRLEQAVAALLHHK